LREVKGSVKALNFWANVILLKFEKMMLICKLKNSAGCGVGPAGI